MLTPQDRNRQRRSTGRSAGTGTVKPDRANSVPALSMSAVPGVVCLIGLECFPLPHLDPDSFQPRWNLQGRTPRLSPTGRFCSGSSVEAMRWVMPILFAFLPLKAMSLVALTSAGRGLRVCAGIPILQGFERVQPANRLQQMVFAGRI